MATHSSVLAWTIPWTEKPGRLQSMGSPRVGHDWSDLAAAAAAYQIRAIIYTPFPSWTYVWCSKKVEFKQTFRIPMNHILVCAYLHDRETKWNDTQDRSMSLKASQRRWIMSWVLRVEVNKQKSINSFLLQSFGALLFSWKGLSSQDFGSYLSVSAQMPPLQRDLSEPTCLN